MSDLRPPPRHGSAAAIPGPFKAGNKLLPPLLWAAARSFLPLLHPWARMYFSPARGRSFMSSQKSWAALCSLCSHSLWCKGGEYLQEQELLPSELMHDIPCGLSNPNPGTLAVVEHGQLAIFGEHRVQLLHVIHAEPIQMAQAILQAIRASTVEAHSPWRRCPCSPA